MLALRRSLQSAAKKSVFSARSVHTSAVACEGGAIFQHRQAEDNTEDSPFDFSIENYRKVKTILGRYPKNYKASGIIPLLDLGQRQNDNFCSLSVMNKVAQVCEVAPMQVYEVATFYTMFNRARVGKYFIQLCGTTPCMACGAEEIRQTIEDHLDVHNGGTTEDGMFSLLEVECLGACVNAPMIQVNDDFYECLTPDTTRALLDHLREKGPLPMTKYGSLCLNGQYSCEGPLGKTSLHGAPTGVDKYTRELPQNVNPADVATEMYS